MGYLYHYFDPANIPFQYADEARTKCENDSSSFSFVLFQSRDYANMLWCKSVDAEKENVIPKGILL